MKCAVSFPAALLGKAQNLRALLLDVDGVMTDGGLYVGARGEAIKRFHTLDGYGLRLLRLHGVVPLVVSGKDSAALRQRLAALRIDQAHLGADPKLPRAEAALAELGLTWHEVAVVGDDWPDAPLMAKAALAVATPNAHAQVRQLAHHTTTALGGFGAVREVCDLILMAKGLYDKAWDAALNSQVGNG